MFPLLCDSFPEQNIHFWDTPKDYTPENVLQCGSEQDKHGQNVKVEWFFKVF